MLYQPDHLIMNYELDLYIVAYVSDYRLSLIGLIYRKNHRKPLAGPDWGYFPPVVSGEDFTQQTNPVTVSFLWMLMGESCPAGFLAGAMV